MAVTSEIAWLVGRYAFLGLLYLFVLLVLRALVAELQTEPAPSSPAHPAPAPAARPAPGPAIEVREPEPPPAAPEAVRAPVVATLPPRLIIVESPDPLGLPTGTTINLTAVTTLGRGAHNSVALPADKFASTNHALVFVRDGAMHLRDRGSTNGTLLNGERLEGEVALRDGDRITVGATVLRYGAGATPPEGPAEM
jgi:hypothetical protein